MLFTSKVAVINPLARKLLCASDAIERVALKLFYHGRVCSECLRFSLLHEGAQVEKRLRALQKRLEVGK